MLLVVIGPQWATSTDDDGLCRLHDDNDCARLELARALQQPDMLVIPVLGGDEVEMPEATDLPPDLLPLCERQAFRVRSDPHFHNDMDHLIAAIEASQET